MSLKTTLTTLLKNHKAKIPITCITAHDYLTGKLAATSPNIDMVLVGDSLAMTAQGFKSTVQLPFEVMQSSVEAVSRACPDKYLIADLTFGTFESSIGKCIESSVSLMKNGAVDAIKIEGGYPLENHFKSMLSMGIPVVGHLGLQPQKVAMLGGYKVQGNTCKSAIDLYKEVRFLRDLGVKMLVLECVPSKVAQYITQDLDVISIGIGAGNGTSGQVLVVADMLGMNEAAYEEGSQGAIPNYFDKSLLSCLPGAEIAKGQNRHIPKFVKLYADFFKIGRAAVDLYGKEVKDGSFPSKEHGFVIKSEEWEKFLVEVKKV
ncbi:3-methyl-2-oxobutanoate hydroxymethyltransferase [Martiniozyma asiatica (nom. inval.)]|nr:3-methyl-2-oxobutanoate hydroxymethyltransferase [Martiniozyma asiatica]